MAYPAQPALLERTSTKTTAAPCLTRIDCRAESLLGVLEAAKRQLFAILPHLPPDALLELLDESFPYIALRDLKDIPLAVLDRINPVPATFLRQIAADADLFQELPIGVQRQANSRCSAHLLSACSLPV